MIDMPKVRELAKVFLPGLADNEVEDALAQLRVADIVFAVCPNTGREVLVHGQELLERTVSSGTTSEMLVLRVPVERWENDGPEWLTALVQCLRPN